MGESVLKVIKNRRTIARFEESPVGEEKVKTILEAGRWAPSWHNRQPWKFLVIKDQEIRERVSEVVPNVFKSEIIDAPLSIVVCVDPEQDPYHYVEDGAIATQNMALAAQSLGLGSIWIGVFNLKGEKESREAMIKEILDVPDSWRVISLLPIGVPESVPTSERKKISEIVSWGYAP
ncbi:hypothetical protein AKJ57_05880 [candidate division MSBL1 archaeon SCGC-AAA259A05]|uniref:Nitroreductase domain-containing protein n=1 Tax=candidate division MSBL1 archaeon SCGC-AAA259A05 TaxID=1698259 RepID=A0A133U4G0_9EURY|nr:hypothetical protein AKJ57_05880 [candidate division MSBL1 archaeon SCGC-AAA259A05]